MQIAMNGWFWGAQTTGSGQYLQHLAGRLPEIDPQAAWILVLPRAPEIPLPPAWRAVVVAPPQIIPGENLRKVWFEQLGFPRACRRLGVDLAHVPYWGSPWWSPCPVVVTIHDLIPLLLPAYRGGPLPRVYTWLVTHSARRARLILTDSQASSRDLATYLHVPAAHIRVTPLAAPDSYQRVGDPEIVEAVRARYGLPQRYVLFMGGFDVRKNVGLVLRAFARAAARGEIDDDVMLVIAGRLPLHDNRFTPDPRPLARALEIGSRVVFTGWIAEADKPALYSLAEVVVFPSHYEGFGLPVLEALACGFDPTRAGTAGA